LALSQEILFAHGGHLPVEEPPAGASLFRPRPAGDGAGGGHHARRLLIRDAVHRGPTAVSE